MANAFEYKGVCEANTWTFEYQFHGDLNGEPIDLLRPIRVSLSEGSAKRLKDALKGHGLNRENQEIANAVGNILNSLSLGSLDAFEIPDVEVDKYLARFQS